MEKAYGMRDPRASIKKMDAGIIYTQVSKASSCLLGEVFTTDGRIQAMHLATLADDKHFFPNYNAAPAMHTPTYKKYPAIAELLDPSQKRAERRRSPGAEREGGRGGGGSARRGEGLAGAGRGSSRRGERG